MKRFRFTRPPRELSRQRVKLDNVALIPASLLPYKEHWQQVANDLPFGSVLIVTPVSGRPNSSTFAKVMTYLRTRGRQVRIISAASV
jgi:hypothetical protein